MKDLILVTGSDGLVGSRFLEISGQKKFFVCPSQKELDITDPNDIKNMLSSYEFKAIVNFAAYTDVGKAEDERGKKESTPWQVNVEGVKNIASAVKPHLEKIHFIQISTDMVFPGNEKDPGPYEESHPIGKKPEDLTWYGYTKAQGEQKLRDILGNGATVLRIIYPVRTKFENKSDYIRKPLQLFDSGSLYPLFSDQQVSVTFIDELCEVLDKIIEKDERGTFHASSENITTPFELISEVIEKVRGVKNAATPISLSDFLSQKGMPEYRYPRYGGLKIGETEKKLNYKFRTWKEIVSELVSQGLGN